MKERLFKSLVSVLTSAMLVAGFMTMPANAESFIDPDEKGSVTVTLKDTSGKPVSDSDITMYYVASVSTSTYVYVDDFSSCKEDINDLTSNTLADALYEYVCDNNIDGITGKTDNSGKIVFDDLAVGIYLFAQDKATTGYDKMLPFIVTVPVLDGVYVYDVDAAPKMEPVEIIPTQTPTPTPTPIATPTPPPTSAGGGDGSSSGTGIPGIGGGASSGTGIDISGSTPDKLPQTGQLNWPIPVCVLSGIFFISIGIFMVRRKES